MSCRAQLASIIADRGIIPLNALLANQPGAVLGGASTLWYNRAQRRAAPARPQHSAHLEDLSVAKSSKGRQRRDWRRTMFLVISVLIVLSMLISMAVAFAPPASP